MKYRRLWCRSGLGLALTIGGYSYLGPQATIMAVPQPQSKLDQSMSATANVFSEKQVQLRSGSSNQSSQSVGNSQADQELRVHTGSESNSSGASSSSTMPEKAVKDQHPQTAVTRDAKAIMNNGSVRMTLDSDGTLHLSGGAFYRSVGDEDGSWITQTLTANGYRPDQVLRIVIDGRIAARAITNYDYLFAGLTNLTSIDGLFNLNLAAVASLKYLFKDDSRLQQVDFGQRNFSKVQSFEGMFYQCSALTNVVNIGQWQTASVTDLSYMFTGCSQLVTLDLNGWNVSQVGRMEGTFMDCSRLQTLNVADWNTGLVTDLQDTFNGASALTTLPIGRWNASNVRSMLRTFAYCSSLSSLDVANWNVKRVTDVSRAFSDMTKLTSLPIDNWQTTSLRKMQFTFYNDTSLKALNIARWDTRQVVAIDRAFSQLNLTTLPIENWNTRNVMTMRSAFADSPNLTTLPIAKWDVSSVIDMNSTFSNCIGLTTLPIANWDVRNVLNLGSTFQGTTNLTELPVGNWDTQSLNNLNNTFADMSSITDLPIANWKTGKVTQMSGTFQNVKHISDLPIGTWDTSQAKDMSLLFFDNPQLPHLPIENWHTGSATNISGMFKNCSGLKELNLGTWNTDKVTKLDAIFQDTTLEKLNLTSWNTNNAAIYKDAFRTKLPPKHLWLGRNFNFHHSTDWGLPDPSKVSPYVGRWHSLNNNRVYTSTELMNQYDGNNIVGEFEWALGTVITVKHVDAAGTTLAADTQISGINGETYHAEPLPIDGYQPDQPDGIRGTFTDKDETVVLKYSPGKLLFVSAPKIIDFGKNKITGNAEIYGATYDTGLVIQDYRPKGSTWSLDATLATTGFRGTKVQSLPATLSYFEDQSDHVLTPGVSSSIVSDYRTDSRLPINVLGAKVPLGALRLKVPTDRVLGDTYQTTITWTLGQTVPNQ